jgi:hypothetical protein
MNAWKQTARLTLGGGLLILLMPAVALAAQSSSTTYQVNEVYFGTGGELNACSGSYCSKQAAGETTVGNTASTSYQAQGGFNTDREPSLDFVVSATNINLGVLNSGTTSTANATFSVKTYLAGGYAVTNASNPPTNSTATLNALATPTASNSTQEQFGINVVANTTGCGAPVNFGANPVQVPDASFSFGAAASGYDTCGLFKYVNGDTIASSNKSSGETDYTISYIFNVSRVTPGGIYRLDHILVATSTF